MVNVLHFVNNVSAERLDTFEFQNVGSHRWAVNYDLTFFYRLTFKHVDSTYFWNQKLMRDRISIGNNQTLLAFGFLAVRDNACNRR